jgi:hypothetical protein
VNDDQLALHVVMPLDQRLDVRGQLGADVGGEGGLEDAARIVLHQRREEATALAGDRDVRGGSVRAEGGGELAKALHGGRGGRVIGLRGRRRVVSHGGPWAAREASKEREESEDDRADSGNPHQQFHHFSA